MKQLQLFENWRNSKKLSDTDDVTGMFSSDDEDSIEHRMHQFEKLCDQGFSECFDKAFDYAMEEGALFGDDFNGYMESRSRMYSDKKVVNAYEALQEAFRNFKTVMSEELESVQDEMPKP